MGISSRLKVIVFILAWLSLGTIALFAGVSWYVNSTHCRSLLLQKLNTMIPASVTAAHHHLSLFNGEVSIGNLTVKDHQGDDLIRIANLSIDLSLTALFKRALVVDAVNIKQPWTSLRMDEAGRLNLVDAFSTGMVQGETTAPRPATKPPFNIVVRHFKLSDGYVSFSAAEDSRHFVLENVGITANGNLKDKSGVLKLGIGRSSMVYQGYTSDFSHIDLAMAVNNGHIEPLVIKAENHFASLLLWGDIYKVFSDPELDLTLDLEVALAEAEAFLDLDRNDTGRVKALLNVKGRPDNPRLNLSVDYGGGIIEGRSIDRAGLELRLADRVATLDQLSADTGFGSLELSGQVDLRDVFLQGFLSTPAEWTQTRFNGRLKTTAINLSSIHPAGGNISGRMDALLNVVGKGVSLETLAADASVMIGIDNFRSGGMAQPLGIRSRMNGRIQAKTIWLDSMEVDAADAFLSAGGSLDIGADLLDAHFNFETREVAPLLSVFGLSQIRGAITASGNVKGSSTNPTIILSTSGSEVGIQDIELGNVMLEAGLNNAGQLEVDALTIENRGSSIKADGDIQLFAAPFQLHPDMPLEARVDFTNMEYGDFFSNGSPDRDIRGSLMGNLVLSGTVQSLKASADVVAKDIEVAQVSLGNLVGKAKFIDGTLLLDSFRLTNNRTNLNARGEIRLLRKDAWQTVQDPTFTLDLVDGHIFLEDFHKDFAGVLTVDSNLAGSLKAPHGNLFLRGKHLDLGVQQVEALTVNLQAADRRVTIEPFTVVMPGGGIVKGEGRVGYDQSFQFSLQTEGLPIDSIDRVREIKDVGGQMDIDIEGRGMLHHPEINGSALLKNIQIRNETIDDANLHFDFKDNRVTLSGRHAFDLEAEYDLTSKSYFLNLLLDKTSLTPWFVIVGRTELSGSVSGRIEAKGMAGTLEGTRAFVDIQNLGVDFKGEPFVAINELRGTLDQQIFNLPGFQVDLLEQGHFTVKGTGDIMGPVNLDVEGDIPLKAANLFIRDLPEIKGVLSLKTSLAGTLKDPQLNGEIMIEEGGIVIPELQQELHRLNGRVALSATGVVDGYLNGMLDSGRFEVETTIEMDGFLPRQIEARINAAALPLQIPDTLEMLFNTDLSVRGTPDKLIVAGDVILLEGTYYKDFKLNILQAIQEEKREERLQRVESPYPYLKPLQFDIHFKHRQPFLVDNNIAYMEISPDAILRGTLENPIITGSATVDNGAITYLKNEFVVQQGAVDFVNPYKTEAEIDIKGEVEVRDWRITIELYGPPDRLTVSFSSSPPEEDADILSLLVFKKTTYELNTGSSGAGQSPTVLLAQLLASSFGEDIKESTGIDILEVEAESAEDKDSTDRIKVTVGKDLSERMTVKYSVESKDGGYVQRASTEYKLFENFLVSGFQDTKGVYGGELIFRLEFRLFQ